MKTNKTESKKEELLTAQERMKLEKIGKEMQTLISKTEELFEDAREIIGWTGRDGPGYQEVLDCPVTDIPVALVNHALSMRGEWRKADIIDQIKVKMQAAGITREDLR